MHQLVLPIHCTGVHNVLKISITTKSLCIHTVIFLYTLDNFGFFTRVIDRGGADNQYAGNQGGSGSIPPEKQILKYCNLEKFPNNYKSSDSTCRYFISCMHCSTVFIMKGFGYIQQVQTNIMYFLTITIGTELHIRRCREIQHAHLYAHYVIIDEILSQHIRIQSNTKQLYMIMDMRFEIATSFTTTKQDLVKRIWFNLTRQAHVMMVMRLAVQDQRMLVTRHQLSQDLKERVELI